MAVTYKKLWKLLIDKDMKKKELAALAGINPTTISKMSRGDNVTVEVLGKICSVLDCKLDDIMEFVPDKPILNKNEEKKIKKYVCPVCGYSLESETEPDKCIICEAKMKEIQ